MSVAPQPERRPRPAGTGVISASAWLLLLQIVHTLIVAGCIACLGMITLYAVTGIGPWLALIAILPPAGVGAGLLLNRGECIMQVWARELAEIETGWARDVLFLPESWALKVVPALLPLFLLAGGGMLVRFALAV
tara:strand:- start:2055 stop:2459 length:405 start_codon:yes stop_codon:yes gene_type:complete